MHLHKKFAHLGGAEVEDPNLLDLCLYAALEPLLRTRERCTERGALGGLEAE